MPVISSSFPPSNIDLHVPFHVADSIVLGGLTASQMRVAIVLISHGTEGMQKPDLEKTAGVALDNAGRFLDDLVAAVRIETPYDPEGMYAGKPVFEGIDYQRGTHRKYVGSVTARLSVTMQYALTSQKRPVIIPADELRTYASVGGILLRLRLGAEFAMNQATEQVDMSIDQKELGERFGSYAGMADIKRKSASGDPVVIRSLARADEKLIQPALRDLRACRSMTVSSEPRVTGKGERRPWSAIDILAIRNHRLVRKPRSIGEIKKSAPRSGPLKGSFRPSVPTKTI